MLGFLPPPQILNYWHATLGDVSYSPGLPYAKDFTRKLRKQTNNNEKPIFLIKFRKSKSERRLSTVKNDFNFDIYVMFHLRESVFQTHVEICSQLFIDMACSCIMFGKEYMGIK